jgi:hypothetical protein
MKKTQKAHVRLDALRYMTVTAMSVAVGTVLAILSKQLFGSLPIRLDLSVLAVMLMALLFGFPHGTLAAVLIDVLSSIFFYPPYLPITFCKLLTGLLFDLLLQKVRPAIQKGVLLFLLNGAVIDCLFMAHALYWLQGGSVASLMWIRVGSAAVNIILFTFFLYVVYPKMETPLYLTLKKGNLKNAQEKDDL